MAPPAWVTTSSGCLAELGSIQGGGLTMLPTHGDRPSWWLLCSTNSPSETSAIITPEVL